MPPTRDDTLPTPAAAPGALRAAGLSVAHDPVEVGARKLALRSALRAPPRGRAETDGTHVEPALGPTQQTCPHVGRGRG
ncbi:hypothetical protein, partial [Kineococcus arenarius]|uniref:hypothetical protein n=1 Tax=Kineococcus sp. SYSU DK007 TaxID=3383128 RepID=UPI003D7ECAB1